jgi:replicative DNA helicase
VSNGGNDQPPPLANVEAEAALIGAMMIENSLVDRVRAIVSEDMFYEPLHGRIFRVIGKFTDAGKIANPVTLKPIFDLDRAMKEVGGSGYLAQLTGSGAAVIGALEFAAQVRDLAHMRMVKASIDNGLEAMLDEGGIEPFLAEVEIAVARASTSIRQVDMFSTEQMIDLAVNRTDKALDSGIPGASCRLISDMDTLLGKLEGGQMTIIAGRPGMGKSTLAMSASLGYALNGNAGLYALCESSAEMFSLKLTADLLHAAGRPILFRALKEGILSRDERRDLLRAREVAQSLPIKFAHVGRTDVKRVEALVAREAMRLKRDGKKLAFCVVDYLQLLTADGRHRVGDDRGRVNAVSEALLSIAQKHDTHMIALSQLSRQVEGREDKRPRLSDLRDSGRLEEDADNVLMTYREEYYLEKAKPQQEGKEMEAWVVDMGHARGKIELIAAKTRFGANAARKANFLGDNSAVRGSNYHSSQGMVDEDEGDLFERFGA